MIVVNDVIWHQLCDATLWIQLLCNPATLQPVSLGGHRGGQSSHRGAVAPWPPLRTASIWLLLSLICSMFIFAHHSQTLLLVNDNVHQLPMTVCEHTTGIYVHFTYQAQRDEIFCMKQKYLLSEMQHTQIFTAAIIIVLCAN